jgi:hypothetical protein
MNVSSEHQYRTGRLDCVYHLAFCCLLVAPVIHKIVLSVSASVLCSSNEYDRSECVEDYVCECSDVC